MRTLYIDLGSHSGALALVAEKTVERLETIDHRIDDGQLVNILEKLLQGSSYKEIDRIACVVGPGGFTSLRVAVGLSNALADQLGIPQCGVHLSDVYRARYSGLGSDSFCWVHSTKKNELFVRGFGKFAKDFPEAVCVKADEFLERYSGEWAGELIEDQRALAEKGGWHALSFQSLPVVLPAFLARQDYPRQMLSPWYGRGW